MSEDPLASVAALPGVFEAVDAARGAVDRFLRELRAPAVRGRVTEVTAEAVRAAAWASAALEGRDGDLADFRAPVPDGLGAGALRLYASLAEVSATWQQAPGQALARMHVLAMSDQVAERSLGRPVGEEAAARLDALTQLVSRPTSAPAVVVAAVVHAEVLATRAFGTGSGLVARAASRCVLVSRGLDPRAATVPEMGHLELGREAYASALDGYHLGETAGVGSWVSHCAQAVALGAQEGRRIAAALVDPR
jgi:hypothetical protein